MKPLKRWLLVLAAAAFPSPALAQPPLTLLYTDWTLVPGRVFYQGAAGEQTLMQVAGGRIYPSEKVRAFFIRYQNRILYGVDANWKPYLGGQPTDVLRQAHIKRLEERYQMDYDYYAGTGSMQYDGRPVQSLGLPRSVLEKFYNQNARRLIAFPADRAAKAR